MVDLAEIQDDLGFPLDGKVRQDANQAIHVLEGQVPRQAQYGHGLFRLKATATVHPPRFSSVSSDGRHPAGLFHHDLDGGINIEHGFDPHGPKQVRQPAVQPHDLQVPPLEANLPPVIHQDPQATGVHETHVLQIEHQVAVTLDHQGIDGLPQGGQVFLAQIPAHMDKGEFFLDLDADHPVRPPYRLMDWIPLSDNFCARFSSDCADWDVWA